MTVSRLYAVMYKQEKRLPRVLTESYIWLAAKWVMSHAPNNIFCQAFILQRWKLFWSTWRAFYFIPHIFTVFWCVVGAVLPPPRNYKSSSGAQPSTQPGELPGPNVATLKSESEKKDS
jgi:hypothetical protein